MAQPETERLSEIIVGALLTRALCTVADLRVADHIEPGSPKSTTDLAKAAGADERSLYRTLRCLASHGVFRETTTGEFDHSALSSVLRSHATGSFHAGAQVLHLVFAGVDGLDHVVRTGEPGFVKVYGKPVFDYMMEHPELAAAFDAGMTCFHGFETEAMLEAYDFGAVEVLADIGGGNGSLISAVLQRYPKMRGLLFDLGHVTARAKELLERNVVAERCRVIEGSFFDVVPPGADAYLMRHILHDWTDEQCVEILRHCRSAVPGHGRLIIVECVVPAGNDPSLSKDFDLLMMTFSGGVERTESEFRALFRQGGFDLASIAPTSTMVSVLEARPRKTR